MQIVKNPQQTVADSSCNVPHRCGKITTVATSAFKGFSIHDKTE